MHERLEYTGIWCLLHL